MQIDRHSALISATHEFENQRIGESILKNCLNVRHILASDRIRKSMEGLG
jgi:hypothetical protein